MTTHARMGPMNGRWKGGRVRGGEKARYWMLWLPDHPRANTQGYVLEHRVIVERTLGRYLEPGEVVHHKNGDPADNDPENLEVLTQAEHMARHAKTECRRGHPYNEANTYIAPGSGQRYCRACQLEYKERRKAS